LNFSILNSRLRQIHGRKPIPRRNVCFQERTHLLCSTAAPLPSRFHVPQDPSLHPLFLSSPLKSTSPSTNPTSCSGDDVSSPELAAEKPWDASRSPACSDCTPLSPWPLGSREHRGYRLWEEAAEKHGYVCGQTNRRPHGASASAPRWDGSALV